MSKIILDIDVLIEHNLTTDQYFFLFCIHTGRIDDLLKYVDKFGKLLRADIIDLYSKGFISYDLSADDEFDPPFNSIMEIQKLDLGKITLTVFSEELLKPLVTYFEGEETVDDFEVFARLQYEKFPEKVKAGGYLVRSGFKDFARKLKRVMKSEKLDRETVDKSFTLYIEQKRRENWEFMQLATYFVKKADKSTLISLYEELKQNPNLEHEQSRGNLFTTL